MRHTFQAWQTSVLAAPAAAALLLRVHPAAYSCHCGSSRACGFAGRAGRKATVDYPAATGPLPVLVLVVVVVVVLMVLQLLT
jgi:hypothetical protein